MSNRQTAVLNFCLDFNSGIFIRCRNNDCFITGGLNFFLLLMKMVIFFSHCRNTEQIFCLFRLKVNWECLILLITCYQSVWVIIVIILMHFFINQFHVCHFIFLTNWWCRPNDTWATYLINSQWDDSRGDWDQIWMKEKEIMLICVIFTIELITNLNIDLSLK